jgi:hypothetical protein
VRQGIFILGIVVIIIGVLIAGGSFTLNSQSNTIPQQGVGCLTIPPSTLVGGSVTLAWSGADQGFSFSVYEQSGSGCDPGSLAAAGSGPSGSLTFSVSSGVTYVVLGSGNSLAVPVTLTVSGLTPLLLGGIVVAVGGAVLGFFGYIMKAKPRRARAPPPAPRSILPPLPRTEEEMTGPVYTPPAPRKVVAPESSGPVFFKPSGPEELYGANAPAPAAPPAQGEHPWIKCAHCGTMNEPWLHNCRYCKRGLTSTGG